MRTKLWIVAATVVLALGAVAAGEDDYHNCAICKPMMAEKGLMEHMQWESHPIGTGMLSITTVDADYEAAYARAHGTMMKTIENLGPEQEATLCPFCKGMTELAKAGAEFKNIDSKGAHILAVTSQDPQVVGKIHAHLRFVNEQMGGHEGHDHEGS